MVVEAAEEERSVSWRKVDCAACFGARSAPSLRCVRQRKESRQSSKPPKLLLVLGAHEQQESWTVQSLAQPRSLL